MILSQTNLLIVSLVNLIFLLRDFFASVLSICGSDENR